MPTQFIWQGSIVNENGDTQANAQVEIRVASSGALATLYEDRDGTTPKANPFQADVNGYAFAYMLADRYNITASKSGFSRTWSDVLVMMEPQLVITSVNGVSGGDIVIDPDNLDDSSSVNKFTTAGDITKLAGIEVGAEVDDKDVVVSGNDTTPGYLVTKIVAGANVTVTETNDGGNETLVIASTASGDTDTKEAKVSSNDTTPGFLNGKLIAGAGITLTENNDGGDETLSISREDKSALVTLGSNLALSAGDNVISWDNEEYDAGGIVDLGTQPTRLTVPAGATLVQLGFNLLFGSKATTEHISVGGRMAKNGSLVYDGITLVTKDSEQGNLSYNPILHATSPPLVVSGGDYFELRAYLGTTNIASPQLLASSQTQFWMRVLK